MKVHRERIRHLNERGLSGGPILYWMHRDQRLEDNWALLHAQTLAGKVQNVVCIAFCLVEDYAGANWRAYDFMLRGLRELEKEAGKLNIPFHLLRGGPETQLPRLAQKLRAGAVVTDFSPLRIKRRWDDRLAGQLPCPLIEVDAHNIVPARYVSDKQEYAARTIRPKIHRLLDAFLTGMPRLRPQRRDHGLSAEPIDWAALEKRLRLKLADPSAEPIDWLTPGGRAARRMLKSFVAKGLDSYDRDRNDPTLPGQSNLSPYLHFGQLAPQRAALAARQAGGASVDAFLEELIVRRELSDNFCLHNIRYDSFEGLPDWARRTLNAHRADKRDDLYEYEQFDAAETHDAAWNAAQRQMIRFGKMHGYMRMYWAKKILEWSESPERAIEIAIALNDRYELDGRDPNGYVGVLWSIGGLHDRPWRQRRVFGTVRYMAESGLKRKFDLDAYIQAINTGINPQY